MDIFFFFFFETWLETDFSFGFKHFPAASAMLALHYAF